MLAESVEIHNDNNNNNNFSVFAKKEEERGCDSDDENIDVEIGSDVDDCSSELGDSEDLEPQHGRLCETRSEQDLNDSDASHNSSPRLKNSSPNLPEIEDNGIHSKRKISALSFGIDRILNEESEKMSPQVVRRPGTDSDSRNQVLLANSMLSPVGPQHLPSIAAPHQRTLPLDLVSPLNPFHSSFIAPDVCRMDSSSLEMLPVRSAWPDVYVCPWTGVQRDRFGLVRRVGHPYQNRTPPKRKKPRTAFTRQQVLELEKRFTRQKYLASAERSALAKTLNMTDAQVKTWFQNRRTKWRRQTAEEREIERQAAHKFLMSLRQDDTNRSMPYTNLCGVSQSTSLPGSDSTAPSAVNGVN